MRTPISAALLTIALIAPPALAEQESSSTIRVEQSISKESLQAAAVLTAARHLFHRDPDIRHAAIAALKGRGEKDVVPALIQAHRFVDEDEALINDALRHLT